MAHGILRIDSGTGVQDTWIVEPNFRRRNLHANEGRSSAPYELGDEFSVKLTKAIFASILLLSALLRAQEPARPETGFAAPGLAPGDQLSVRMFDFPELSGLISVHVAADGTIHLPYAGTINALGMSPDGLQRAISDALRDKGIVKDPNVMVEVVSAVNLTVNVIGQVQSPRSIPLYAPAPVSFVLAQVGGLTGLADHRLTILRRGDQLPTSVDYDPDAPTPATLNTMINPGDVISVSNRGVFFISGEVNRPGIFPMGGVISVGQASPLSGEGVVKNMTLLDGLSLAGGVTAIAARSKMHILRTVDGKRVDIQVDQVKLSKGEVADPLLLPNDIVYVPSSYLRQQTNNLFSTAVSSLYAATSIKAANF
jgi:polysaccharide export outer membrane protein